MQLSMEYKEGGTAVANTCGTWKYGTKGRAGIHVHSYCKATERDAGTTGTVHLTSTASGIDASAFTQEIKLGAPNTYQMTTKYWNDPPCASGEEFVRCSEQSVPASGDAGGCNKTLDECRPALPEGMSQDDYNTKYPRENYACYTGKTCTQAACKCKQTCCINECPRTMCTKDTHDECLPEDRAPCPMWAQCIVNGNCDSSWNALSQPCVGVSGAINGKTCAATYPGCGAVNEYDMKYNGEKAVQFLTIHAEGTIKEVEVTEDVRLKNLCGANNNMFSYTSAGSASLLATSASVPVITHKYQQESTAEPGVMLDKETAIPCCTLGTDDNPYPCNTDVTTYDDFTLGMSGSEALDACTCQSGHPTWCECSKLVEMTITKVVVTAETAEMVNIIQSTCPCASSVTLGAEVDLSACTTTTCAFLDYSGYNSNSGKYYAQLYRPGTIENAIYIGHQALTIDEALDIPVHAEGVYTLEETCASGAVKQSAQGVLTMTIAALLGTYLIIH